jgi:ubiquinone biosynthesis protein Coq4
MESEEATLEEEPSLKEARQIVAERLGGSQTHDPNMVQLPEGGWGRLVQKQDGGYMVAPVQEAPPTIEVDDDFESAVNTVTREELKVTALAIMKKVAMSPSTVMGYAYLQSMKTDEGVPYFEGDIGDFFNYCVKFTLKFGFGAELAIVTGKPTLSDLFKTTSQSTDA